MKYEDITPSTIKYTNYNIRSYIDYVDGVLDGSITANKYIKLACQRFKDWFDRDDMYFDLDDVDRRIRFIYKLKHNTGEFAGRHFRLLPWQAWVVASIYGFKWKHNNLRVTRNVFIMISRKAGKTALCAAIALCNIICDKERDAEVDLIANNSKQAAISLKHIQYFIKSVDPDQKIFKRYRGEIKIPALDSNIQVLSSDSMGLDGYSASTVILDEMHAMKNWDLYNVMKSSQGARQQPLMINITTAGFLIGDAYPCYSMWSTCKKILEGQLSDDTQFAAIYQLDEGDDYKDQSVWPKCSPSVGETQKVSYIEEQVNAAQNNVSLRPGILTKTFNEWCQSEDIWLSYDLLKQHSMDFTLEELRDRGAQECWIGVDLSAVSDISALSVCVPLDNKFYFKTYCFVPEDTLSTMNGHLYKLWSKSGDVIVTEGNVIDYDYILDKVKQIDKIIMIKNIAYDTWNATQFAINCTNEGLPMSPFSQALGNFNRCTKEFERLLKTGKIVLDDSGAVTWCFGNATLKRDNNDNCKPTKSGAHSGKIDAVIAILQSLGIYMQDVLPDAEMTIL